MRHRSGLLTLLVCSIAAAASADEALEVKANNSDVRVVRSSDKAEVILDITSPQGFGSASIERKEANWPKRVVLRLHLKGLEGLRIARDKTSLEMGVANTSPYTAHAELRTADNPLGSQVEADSPYFPKTKLVGMPEGDGGINVENRYFEVEIPDKLFEDNPPSVSLHWIDFYRG